MLLCPFLLFSCLGLNKNTAHMLKFKDWDWGINKVYVNSSLNGKRTLDHLLLPRTLNFCSLPLNNVIGLPSSVICASMGFGTQGCVFPPQVWGLTLPSTWTALWKADSSLCALQKAGSQNLKFLGKTSREKSCWLSLSIASKMKMACSM